MERGVAADRMTPAMGVAAMLDFYEQTRFSVSPGGDTLRLEWHIDRHGAPRIQFTVARDLVWPSAAAKDGVERWSMWITFHSSGAELAPDASDGVQRCSGAAARDRCGAVLESLPIYRRIADHIDDSVEIGFDPTPR
jgi:hypothetical protein